GKMITASGTDVSGSGSAISGTSGTFTVNTGPLDHFFFSAAPATVAADGSATFTAIAKDAANNTRAEGANYNVTAGSGAIGLKTGLFTPNLVGSATIEARNGTIASTTTILVTVGALDHVSFTSAPSTLPADTTGTFTASAYDVKGNARADPITYTSNNASVGSISATTGLSVTPGGLHHVTFTSAPTSTDADTPVTFTAQARDSHDNARADAITYGIVSGSGSIGSATGVYSPNLVGATVIS